MGMRMTPFPWESISIDHSIIREFNVLYSIVGLSCFTDQFSGLSTDNAGYNRPIEITTTAGVVKYLWRLYADNRVVRMAVVTWWTPAGAAFGEVNEDFVTNYSAGSYALDSLFRARFSGVHAFGYNYTEREPIWMKSRRLWVHLNLLTV